MVVCGSGTPSLRTWSCKFIGIIIYFIHGYIQTSKDQANYNHAKRGKVASTMHRWLS